MMTGCSKAAAPQLFYNTGTFKPASVCGFLDYKDTVTALKLHWSGGGNTPPPYNGSIFKIRGAADFAKLSNTCRFN